MTNQPKKIDRNPYANDPFVLRSQKAKNMVIAAGLTSFMRQITKFAADGAGRDHGKYYELIRQKIREIKAGKAERQRLIDKDNWDKAPVTPPAQSHPTNPPLTTDDRPRFHPLLVGHTLTREQWLRRQDMVQDASEMLAEGATDAEVLLYLKRTYGLV